MDITAYTNLLHRRPLCGNRLGEGMYARDKEQAVGFRYIQHSHPNMRRWIVVDLDEDDWYFRLESSGLPIPTYTCSNPENRHTHLAWLLSEPVSFGLGSRQKPQMFFNAVHRGFTSRLSGDFRYHGLFTKTPNHPTWETHWHSSIAYHLAELDDVLTKEDKKFTKAERIESGVGRNVDLFDRTRQVAYRLSVKLKEKGGRFEEFRDAISEVAFEINSEFGQPLGRNEVRSTIKSITEWTWNKYNGGDSEAQRQRVMHRWLKKNGAEVGKPWLELGISRRTWYNRRAKGSLPDVCASPTYP